MQEKLVIVPKKTTGGHKAGMIAFFVLTCLCLVLRQVHRKYNFSHT